MRLKVLPALKNKTVEFRCVCNRQVSSSQTNTAQTKFRFDCFASKESRWQWLHKEEEEFHGVSDVRSYVMPVTPACVDDYIEVAITWMSLMGVL